MAGKNGGAVKGRASVATRLPAIDVARFEEIGHLLERLVAANQSLFIEKGQEYRAEHRAATGRPLTAVEAAQIAAATTDERPVEERARAFQNTEGLYAYDEPDQRELLLAAGVATAPQFVAACRQVVALVEMPTEDFWAALSADELPETIDAAADALRRLELKDARKRTTDALDHFATEAGVAEGNGVGLLIEMVKQALVGAMTHLQSVLPSSSSTDSALRTDGPVPISSASGTLTPSR